MGTSAGEARPAFHDPALRQAFEEAAPNIEGFTARLDRLSSDIKTLEGYLEGSAVRVPVFVMFAADRRWISRGGQREYGEYLAWDKGEPERFRVVYYKLVPGEEYPEEADRSILIEAPLDVRVRSRRALPDLLRAVSRAAALGDDDAVADSAPDDQMTTGGPPAGDDDIPF